MKKSLTKDTIINIGFYGGLTIKAIDAFIEFICGFLLMVLNHDWLHLLIQHIALPELTEDPQDAIMKSISTLGQNFSISSQHSVAIYLLLHGITKLAVIWLLWKKKLWAYPIAVVVFGIFIVYEIYSYMHNPSVLLPLLIILDFVMIVMIILEYNRFKIEEVKQEG